MNLMVGDDSDDFNDDGVDGDVIENDDTQYDDDKNHDGR